MTSVFVFTLMRQGSPATVSATEALAKPLPDIVSSVPPKGPEIRVVGFYHQAVYQNISFPTPISLVGFVSTSQ